MKINALCEQQSNYQLLMISLQANTINTSSYKATVLRFLLFQGFRGS